MNKKMINVTVGIPAHNEEKTLGYLLQDVLTQESHNHVVTEIIIMCDGCTDRTADVARKIGETDKRIVVIDDGKRCGKTGRLNQIYRRVKSDIVITLDADIRIRKNTFDALAREFINDASISLAVASPNPHPVKSTAGICFWSADTMWGEIRESYRNGANVHSVYGQVCALSHSFAQNIVFPKNLASDVGYLYIKALEYGKFSYVKEALYDYYSVGTLEDFRRQGTRAITAEKDLELYFPAYTISETYTIPLGAKITGILKSIVKHPLHTIVGLSVNILLRFIPTKDPLLKKGMWNTVQSTKEVYHG